MVGDNQIIVMTPEQLREFSFRLLEDYDARKAETRTSETYDPTEVVFGIRGIMGLFGVSKATANHWKQTWLKEAVSQRGRKIVTNVAKARQLFDNYKSR